MRAFVIAIAAALSLTAVREAAAQNCVYGCCVRPACGKVCKLVCEKTKLVAVGYGSECKDICVPGPSRQGCKHCYVTCCDGDECGPACDCPRGNCDCGGCGCGGCGCKSCEEQKPRIEFCWYDWFACGCAKPRTVRLLTKFQAEKEVCSYHWEVVDACECCCPADCGAECSADCAKSGADGQRVYKPAPPEARIGDKIALTYEDREELAPIIAAGPQEIGTPLAEAVATADAQVADVKANAATAETAEVAEESEAAEMEAAAVTPASAEGESSMFGHLREALRLSKETQ